MTTDFHNIESAARYGNLCRVAIDFAIICDSDIEAHYAYLNARWAARLALAELNDYDVEACIARLKAVR